MQITQRQQSIAQQQQQQQHEQEQEQQKQHQHRRHKQPQQHTRTTTATTRATATAATTRRRTTSLHRNCNGSERWQRQQMLLTVIAVAFATVTFAFGSIECAQIPTRFFYEHANGMGIQQDVEPAETKLRLLRDAPTDALSMDFYRKLNNITDLDEFIENFVDKDSIDPQLGIQENLKRNVERASAVQPKRAVCMPDNTIVPLTPLSPSRDPNVIYFPECTRVKRCGGCCGSALLACLPTETETINFEVTKYLRQNGKTRYSSKEIVVVEQHTKCLCNCRIQEEDCNSYQLYRKDLCRCECKNHDSREKCLTDHKIWDEAACRCVCRDNQSCTTGTVFDENQCKCISQNPFESSLATPNINDRKRFIIKAVPVEEQTTTVDSV